MRHERQASSEALLSFVSGASKGFDPETAPKGLIDRLCAAGGFPNLETMQAHLVETEGKVAEIFRTVLGDPRSGP